MKTSGMDSKVCSVQKKEASMEVVREKGIALEEPNYSQNSVLSLLPKTRKLGING